MAATPSASTALVIFVVLLLTAGLFIDQRRLLAISNLLQREGRQERVKADSEETVSGTANLFGAWKKSPISCDDWITAQRDAKSYVDAYVVGSQKGGTSELARRMYGLGVTNKTRIKEWHMFNAYSMHNYTGDESVILSKQQLDDLRLRHYLSAFKTPPSITSDDEIELVHDAPLHERMAVVDMTVEYLHNEHCAILARAVTPHAKILITIRDPIDRALSEYNMIIRVANDHRPPGEATVRATKEEFDELMRGEVAALKTCGYDWEGVQFEGSTYDLLNCTLRNFRRGSRRFFVLRGLYPLHIQAWRRYFPDRYIQYISFRDMTMGSAYVFNDLTKFLCLRPFPQEKLQAFADSGSKMSFGQQNALLKQSNSGSVDSYDGDNEYLTDILPETRHLLEEFFEASNRKTVELLGMDPF